MPTIVSVQTAQNVTIDYPVASLGDRILAYIIDSLILGAWAFAMILMLSLGSTSFRVDGEVGAFVIIALIGIPYVFYHLICEIFFNGQSIGKRQMKIRVISMEGARPTVGSFLLRWILRPIDNMLYGAVAMITISSGAKGQRLGDMAAGTTVVKLKEPQKISGSDLYKVIEQEEYKAVYPEAIRLTDKDIEIIQEALKIYRNTGNLQPVLATDAKIREILGINPDVKPLDFLPQIVKDHIGLA